MKFKIFIWVCVILGTARVESSDYKKVGDTLTLTPDISSFPDPIKTITWKHGKNKVTELDPDFSSDVDYYASFKDRTTLDTQTGHLVITDLQTSDTGVYSLELNSKLQETTFNVAVIKEVTELKITVNCETPKSSCTLSCEGDTTGAEPVTYSWRGGEKVLGATDKQLTVTETDHKIETFTCQMKNPVSEKSSPPHKNPFHPDGLPEKVKLGISVFIIFLCIVLVVIAVHRYMSGVWFYQKESVPWEAAFWTKEPESGELGGANGTKLAAEGDKLNTVSVGN